MGLLSYTRATNGTEYLAAMNIASSTTFSERYLS